MAKITISRIFEVSLIATSKAYTELQPFIDYVVIAVIAKLTGLYK